MVQMKRNLKPKVQDPETAQRTRSLKSVLLNPCRLSSRVSARRSAVILEKQKPTSEPERKRRLEGKKGRVMCSHVKTPGKVQLGTSLRIYGLPMWLSGKDSLLFNPCFGRILGERNGNRFQYSCLGNPKDMEPGRLQSLGSQRVRHNLATRQQQLRISN